MVIYNNLVQFSFENNLVIFEGDEGSSVMIYKITYVDPPHLIFKAELN